MKAVDVGVKSVLCVGQVSCCGYNDLAGDMVTGHTATSHRVLSNMSCALLNQIVTQILLFTIDNSLKLQTFNS